MKTIIACIQFCSPFTCFILFQVTFLLIFSGFSSKHVFCTKLAISFLVANLFFYLAVKCSDINLFLSTRIFPMIMIKYLAFSLTYFYVIIKFFNYITSINSTNLFNQFIICSLLNSITFYVLLSLLKSAGVGSSLPISNLRISKFNSNF